MKVAIVAPPYPLEECPAPPLGLTYVAAAFEAAGAEVRLLDYIVSRYTPEKFLAELDRFRPDVVGAGSVTLNFPGAAEIVCTAKRHHPGVITMMGGPHVSFDAENVLAGYPGVDLVVIGEGEETIGELTPRLGDRRRWREISGIAFREDGRIVKTAPRGFIEDLDRLPLPARHLLPLSRYQALGYPISIVTGRGCPYSCIFCVGRRMVGKKVRTRRAERVVDEIEDILSYGLTRINVADDLFVSDGGKVRAVCEEIRRRGLKFTWSAFARANTVDLETLRIMRETGCDSVSFGVETGNPEMLKRIRKGITLEMVRRAVDLCRQAGIVCHTSFMVGLPGETAETLRQTREFAAGLGALYGYHFLAPFPGTTVREEVGRYDLQILTDDWTRYDANSAIVRTSALAPQEIEAFVAAFDREVDGAWQSMVKGYREGTNGPALDMQVEGHFRMAFVYKVLAGDLIESLGEIPRSLLQGGADAAGVLCERLEKATGAERPIIDRTIASFIRSGFIKTAEGSGSVSWYWTHNAKSDRPTLQEAAHAA